ncbi:FAD-binding oxidoreductase [Telmatospirillum siberiense]|uniref:FAD-binding oxidoreductase n=1 Tax=Telmatospirillum siberiense TaxID=382514 RepID=A0A2N3PQT4_9PROT|nr:FAD-binding oxidoreductase [Telmatospirillum siberiense]PKU22758.1 FAD-binding oxidoreductase [Telmatospirillum siberiense]
MSPHAKTVASWGNLSHGGHMVAAPSFHDEIPMALNELIAQCRSVLPYGLGRSYGDVCLNTGKGLLLTERLDRFLTFDATSGILRAEAGVTIGEALRLTVPKGWFVPVTPGTKFVTLGGAVANDVHGKNHHLAGTFGRFVRKLALRRSDGSVTECGPDRERDLFRATIGGLGLTGLIEWVEIDLQPIASAEIEMQSLRFAGVEGFFEMSADSVSWPYVVSWIDCLSQGSALGRGIFMRGRHAETGALVAARAKGGLGIPVTPPVGLVTPLSVRLFNEAYYRRPGATFTGRTHFDPFFYPLDRLHHWNRAYGPRGFYQYQSVLPPETARRGTIEMLKCIAASGQASCLVVLKNFGDAPAAGMLSFPMAGTTLALDFPNRGNRTLALFAALDDIVVRCGGRLYAAKDARMVPAMFHGGYPELDRFRTFLDPAFDSDLKRRLSI